MIDLGEFTTSLREVEPGFWVADETEDVSYPVGTHKVLAGIEDESFWFSHRASVIASIMERYPPPGCVFDVGGGNGFMVRQLRSEGLDAILVEPGEDGARTALDRGLAPVVNSSTGQAGLQPESLPAVGLFDVLEHIEDDLGFLRHLNDLLAVGGRLYLTVPAYGWLWSGEDVRSGHFRRYTARTLSSVLAKSHFRVEFTSYFFAFLPVPILATRTIPTLLGIRKSEAPRAAEHRRPTGVAGKGLDWVLERERDFLGHHTVPFGSSLIAVARKTECAQGT